MVVSFLLDEMLGVVLARPMGRIRVVYHVYTDARLTSPNVGDAALDRLIRTRYHGRYRRRFVMVQVMVMQMVILIACGVAAGFYSGRGVGGRGRGSARAGIRCGRCSVVGARTRGALLQEFRVVLVDGVLDRLVMRGEIDVRPDRRDRGRRIELNQSCLKLQGVHLFWLSTALAGKSNFLSLSLSLLVVGG